MALISPGVQVTVIDESQYQPTAAGTIAYVLLATAQNKLNPSGTVASATTATNAGKLITVTSQRELVSLFGTPTFQVDASDNPLHADERNEYGLLAAYSALGVSNRLYVQRADVDLDQLAGTSIRPTGTPPDGTYWLDLENTNWGIYRWDVNANGFAQQTPIIITDENDLGANSKPRDSIGSIGSYAVVATSTSNPVFYKGDSNEWYAVGSDDWMISQAAVEGTVANPTITAGNIVINNTEISVTNGNIYTVATAINSSSISVNGTKGVYAVVNNVGQLEIRINSLSASSGNVSVPDGVLTIAEGTGNIAAQAGLTVGDYLPPGVQFSSYRDVPAWRVSDAPNTRPWGSIWFKTSATGNGANWGIKEYNALTDSWILQSAPLYESDTAAINNLDPVGGGGGISSGTIYIKYDTLGLGTGSFKPYIKNVAGLVKITGTIPSSPIVYDNTDEFIIEVSVPGSTNTMSAVIALSGTTAATFVADILSANLPNITAAVEASGAISISHLAGGTMKFTQTSGTPLADAGLINDNKVQVIGSSYLASPFTPLTYTYSTTAPFSDPADGTLWYYNNPLDVDILVNDGSQWTGYRNLVGVDARGYTLSATDPAGPILAASQPVKQTDGDPLVPGDLWIDTGDLENYPVIRRYNGTGWELIDNTDQVTTDGILFADARWGITGDIDPIVDDLPSITDMLRNNYIDDDCPDYRLYARGTLLFNTRRSGYNVKRYESQWFANPDSFIGTVTPTVVGAWVSHSGLDENGVPYFGHKAQRNVVVEALKSSIESSVSLREEQVQFNLICCPGYPELIQNMITLNNDRKNTAFIIGDSPLTLNSSSTNITTWATNANLAANNGMNGLVSRSEYLGVFYPSGLGTDLGGESVVVPPSHIMLRTIIRSDNQSYPWFAPAGVRRGLIDNVSSIGYVDTADNNLFRSIGVTAGLRDVLYENNINPLTVLPGVGLVNYGQKTRAAMTSAMDRINVARLVCYLRLVLDQVARPFLFEPNDTITRNQVKAAFEAVLNDVVAKRGIYDYVVVCDTSNNTPDRIDRNELYVDIAIEPVKAIEFIYIPVRLKNTGAIAAGL